MSRLTSFPSARTTPGVIPSDSRRISWRFSDCGKGPSLKLAAAYDSGTGRGSANPLVRIPMKGYSLHFSSWHDLYYVIETQSGRGRVVYAHAWRMCAQYVAERLQSEQSLEEGAATRPDIQEHARDDSAQCPVSLPRDGCCPATPVWKGWAGLTGAFSSAFSPAPDSPASALSSRTRCSDRTRPAPNRALTANRREAARHETHPAPAAINQIQSVEQNH